MRLGLFGGTFNPIHRCHLVIAGEARDRLELDRIVFIPTGTPPHKPSGSIAPSGHRLEMVRLATALDPTFAVSDIEIRRSGASYSIDTLRDIRESYGAATELFFLIGLDAFLEIETCKAAEQLVELCHFLVLARQGCSFAQIARLSLVPPVDPSLLASLDTGERMQLDLPLSSASSLIFLPVHPCDVSASVVRTRLAHKQPVADLLPAPVQSYIIHHKLYEEAGY